MLVGRLKRLRTVLGVGPITALDIGTGDRRCHALDRSIKQAISYCGLCGAGEEFRLTRRMRMPISVAAQQAHSTRAGRGA